MCAPGLKGINIDKYCVYLSPPDPVRIIDRCPEDVSEDDVTRCLDRRGKSCVLPGADEGPDME